MYMGNPAGEKRNFDALEKRRMKAAKLLRQGICEAEVARQLGMHRQSVNRWAHQLNEDGLAGLKKAGRAGRKSRLSAVDVNTIRKALKRGSEALGYKTGLWTTRRVADLIEQKCGVRYHSVHVGKLLNKLGWSCRWLIISASNRDEDTRRMKKIRRMKPKKSLAKETNRTTCRGKQYVRVTAWLPDIGSSNAS
jgi:transposase